MRTRYEAEIDGIPLSSVSSSIFVTDIQEAAPNVYRSTVNYPVGDGQRILRTVRQSLRVTVTFEIHDRRIRNRADVCERVQKWAKGRILKVNYRPDQRLRVICETQPTVASALKWTDSLVVVFSTLAVPFWEDALPTRITALGDGGMSAYVRGTAQNALVEATVANTGNETITAATLRAGDSTIAFSGISIPPGGNLALAYDDERVLSAKIGATSVLAKRTVSSDDDLIVPCGQKVAFSVSETGAGAKTTFSVRGCYL